MIGGFIFSAAIRDFMRPKRIVAWLLIILAAAAITRLFVFIQPRAVAEDIYINTSGLLVFRILALASAIFASAVVSAEIEQKTIVYLLTRPIPRWQLYTFRSLAAAVVVGIIGVLLVGAVSFGAHGPMFLSSGLLARDLRGALVGGAVYVPIFVAVSLLMNRAMIVNLLYAFGWETIVPRIPGDLRYTTVAAHLDAISERPATDLLPINLIPPSHSWQILTILGLGSLLFGMFWFSHFEFLPREDSE